MGAIHNVFKQTKLESVDSTKQRRQETQDSPKHNASSPWRRIAVPEFSCCCWYLKCKASFYHVAADASTSLHPKSPSEASSTLCKPAIDPTTHPHDAHSNAQSLGTRAPHPSACSQLTAAALFDRPRGQMPVQHRHQAHLHHTYGHPSRFVPIASRSLLFDHNLYFL
jgi:hypothetical protein